MSYAIVAISSQTQLQEDIPEDVRGRVFGVLNLVLSVGTFIPIIVVGLSSDLINTTTVILVVAVFVTLSGIASVVMRGGLQPADYLTTAETKPDGRAFDAIGMIRTDEAGLSRSGRPKRRDAPKPPSEPNPESR